MGLARHIRADVEGRGELVKGQHEADSVVHHIDLALDHVTQMRHACRWFGVRVADRRPNYTAFWPGFGVVRAANTCQLRYVFCQADSAFREKNNLRYAGGPGQRPGSIRRDTEAI